MTLRKIRSSGVIAVAATILAASHTTRVRAHQLPISEMTVVADADFLHVELVVNAEEVNFFSSMDDDRDGRLDATELEKHGPVVATAVFDKLSIRIGNRETRPDSVGYVPGGDGHHLVFRGHYPGDAREKSITVQSRLGEVMRTAHVTQLTLQSPQGRRSAVLDSRSPRVTFLLEKSANNVEHRTSAKKVTAVELPAKPAGARPNRSPWPWLAAAAVCVGWLFANRRSQRVWR